MSAAFNFTPNLTECTVCAGTGWQHPDKLMGACRACNGTGGVARETPEEDSSGESRIPAKTIAKMVRNILANELGVREGTQSGVKTTISDAVKEAVRDEVRKQLEESKTVHKIIRDTVTETVFPPADYMRAHTIMRKALEKVFEEEARKLFHQHVSVTYTLKPQDAAHP